MGKMAKNKFNGVENIEDLLQSIGATIEPPEVNPIQDARDALRRHTAQETEIVYANALKRVGKELEYSSARHLATGLFGLLTDSTYTLWKPIKDVIQSPVVKKMIEEKTGKDKTLVEYLASQQGKGKNEKVREKAVADFSKSLEVVQRQESYFKNLADYCKETGKSPDAVLKSTRDNLAVVERTYGSIEEYEKIQVEAIKGLSKLVNKLDQIENIPLNMLIPVLITSKTSVSDLSEIGVDPKVLANIVQSYVKDVAKFSKTFLIESTKYTANAIAQYKELKQKE